MGQLDSSGSSGFERAPETARWPKDPDAEISALSIKQAAILDALPANIVLLDAEGVIVSVNCAWREFADANHLADPGYGIGRNYLEICERVPADEGFLARRVAAGIRAVLSGEEANFSLEYACDSPTEERSFLLTATPVADEEARRGAVIMHLDISERKRREEDLRLLAIAMDAMPDGIFMVDQGRMRAVYANEAACRLFGVAREQLLALKPWEALRISRAELEREHGRALLSADEVGATTETLWSAASGPPVWIETRRHAQFIAGRRTIVSVVRDVSARKEAQNRIAYLNRVYSVLSRINTLIVRVRDRVELFREACRLAVEDGALAAAWIGVIDRNLNIVVPVASAGMEEEILLAITERLHVSSLAAPESSLVSLAVGEKRVIFSNDSEDDSLVFLGKMYARSGIHSLGIFPLIMGDEVVGVLVLYARESGFFHEEERRLLTELANDVAFAMDHLEKQERLHYLAYHDVLTGLANRTLFLERAEQCVRSAARSGHMVALCLCDLERFKNINESLGRAAGDALLQQVALWLTRHAGDANVVARIDADRFAVLLPEVESEEDATRLLEEAIKAFSNHSFDLHGTDYRMSLKIGVALCPDDGEDAETLCQNAEAALKKTKVSGDRYLFYARKMTETAAGRLHFENQLRRALELDEFVLHYQPKSELATGKLMGAEALIRWNDPRTGMVPPGNFIPILEETGLIHEVGRWALKKAIEDYLRWRAAGLPVMRIAVNVSPLQLQDRDFIADIERIIEEDAAAAEGLELELTESLIMRDVKLSVERLGAIRAKGVRIAIDDFGTGFSSLSQLAKLPVDTVKIDRSFVVDMVSGPEGMSLISIIINLAHSLKLKVVAEGVETEEQSRLLRLLGCDEMQGFLLSRPLPAAQFAEQFLCAPQGAEHAC